MERTIDQNKYFHKLLYKCGYTSEKKKDLVRRMSGGRTDSSKYLDYMEMSWCIDVLNQEWRSAFKRYSPAIATCCYSLGWTKIEDGKSVIDDNHLSAYTKKYYKADSLYKVQANRLESLIVSLKQIAKSKGIKL